jgi:hypothetical protein
MFWRNLLPLSSGLKCVGKQIGSVIKTGCVGVDKEMESGLGQQKVGNRLFIGLQCCFTSRARKWNCEKRQLFQGLTVFLMGRKMEHLEWGEKGGPFQGSYIQEVRSEESALYSMAPVEKCHLRRK